MVDRKPLPGYAWILRVVRVVQQSLRSPTVTATLGCDFRASLEVNNMTSVLSPFNFNIIISEPVTDIANASV